MARSLWTFLPFGYLLTVLIETPILIVGLSRDHPFTRRLVAGFWLTAGTYPIVILVLPFVLGEYSRAFYLLVAEIFAPVAECLLFRMAFGSRGKRDFATIVIANLCSFGVGELLNAWNWFGLFG